MSAISLLTPRSIAPVTAVEEPVLLTSVVNISRNTITEVWFKRTESVKICEGVIVAWSFVLTSYSLRKADQFLGCNGLLSRHVTFPESSTSKPR